MLNLLIATTNKGKVKEFEQLLSDFPIKLKNLNEFEQIPEPIEDGKTFAENAELKARYYSNQTNSWALADDSGLEVESLKNRPGVHSARYAGEKATELDNIKKLLFELKNNNDSQRKARFVCQMAISDANGKILYSSRGVCTGNISLQPSGNRGFGYDPIFIPTGHSKTFGKLPNEIKQQISHRFKAVKGIIDFLYKFRLS